MRTSLGTWVDQQEYAEEISRKLMHAFCVGLGPSLNKWGRRQAQHLVDMVVSRSSSSEPAAALSESEDVEAQEHGIPAGGGGRWRELAARCFLDTRRRGRERRAETEAASIFLWFDEVEAALGDEIIGGNEFSVQPVRELYPRPRARLRSFAEAEALELEPGFSETVLKTRPRTWGTVEARLVYKGHARPPKLVLD